MKIYLVGGAVRDKLLGLPIKERDWVVVGATVADMLKLGYKQVGKEFPVFLHPKNNEEYALARMERKVDAGYTGFTFDVSPEVTLEEDLQRRDLTINAMAESSDGQLIDPYHGKEDLDNRVLRHVSNAFIEDPVRILRIGRFLARYAYLGFHVAEETIVLMRKMVASGEVDALVAERVWKELERALTEKNPQEFFSVLAQADALKILFPMLSLESSGLNTLKTAATLSSSAAIRFAALFYFVENPKQTIGELCNRYRIPNAYRELALLTAQNYQTALRAKTLSAEELLQLFAVMDIYRREARFQDFLIACKAIAEATQHDFEQDFLTAAAQVAKSVDVQALLVQGFEGIAFAKELKRHREEQLAFWLESNKS